MTRSRPRALPRYVGWGRPILRVWEAEGDAAGHVPLYAEAHVPQTATARQREAGAEIALQAREGGLRGEGGPGACVAFGLWRTGPRGLRLPAGQASGLAAGPGPRAWLRVSAGLQG